MLIFYYSSQGKEAIVPIVISFQELLDVENM